MTWKPIKGALTAPVGMRWWNREVERQAEIEGKNDSLKTYKVIGGQYVEG